MNNNYSGRPTALIHIFEHFVFFSAFDKAKNAHKGEWGVLGPLRKNNISYVQARRSIVFAQRS